MPRIVWKFILLILILSSLLIAPGYSARAGFTGTESIISPATWGYHQKYPAIWEDRVVWAHYYPDPESPGLDNSDIYLLNLTSGHLVKIPTALPYQDTPDIWDDRIVWIAWEDNNLEIHHFNLTTGEELRITNDLVDQVNPQVWGDRMVWQEGIEGESECSVHVYDLQTGNITKLGDLSSSSARSPAIWGDRMVWEDTRNASMGNHDIYLFNFTSGKEVQITTDPHAQLSPSIWGNRIVWLDDRNNSQIYLYDLISGYETCITSGSAHRESPVIYGDAVIYVNNTVVSLVDLSTMVEYPLSTDTTGSSKHDPEVWGNRIVWSDMRNGDFDIYLYTLGTSMSPLIANFTAGVTQGEPPLIVTFNDTSSGQVDGWHWDFGDGNSSTEQNPLHTYDSAGSYSVILTVHNSWQRDAVRKMNLISVGSEPVPAFTQNKTSGPAPLVIQFTDESAGFPTSWVWDFGDGGTADERSPVHLYTRPGVYNVNLTVSNIFGNTSVKKPDLIAVMDGTYLDSIFPANGIYLTSMGNATRLELNTTEAVNCSLDIHTNQTVLTCVPDSGSRITQMQFIAQTGSQFGYEGNDTITGTFDEVYVLSSDLHPTNLTQKIGNNSFYNFTLNMDAYYPGGIVHSVAWEGCTPEDLSRFNDIKVRYNYGNIEDLAYTVRFQKENIGATSPATLVFGVSSDWVRTYGWGDNRTLDIRSVPEGAKVYIDMVFYGLTPINVTDLTPGSHEVVLISKGYHEYNMTMVIADERDSVHVIRIGDDGSGEVLNTTFIGYDPVQNLDFFRAESPNGLSTFGLASLSGSGNIFQIAQMTAAAIVRSSSGGGGGGSGSGSSWVPAQATTSVPTPAPTFIATVTESQGDANTGITVSPGVTMEPGEPAPPQTTGEDQQGFPSNPLPIGTLTLSILKNLSIVFVVIFVTVVFYLRWKKKEE